MRSGTIPIRAEAHWLACTDKVCVPEQGELVARPAGRRAGRPSARSSTNGGGRCRGRWPARRISRSPATSCAIAIPLPASVDGRRALFLPGRPTGRSTMPRRSASAARATTLVAELQRNGAAAPQTVAACSRSATGAGSSSARCPGRCPRAARRLGGLGAKRMLLGGARRDRRRNAAQPDALRVPDPGVEGAAPVARAAATRARRGAMRLAYAAGAIVGTGALGVALLAIRAGGERGGLGVPAAGPAHDHAAAAAGGRDHRQPARPVRAAGARRQRTPGRQLRHRRARRLRRDALRRAVPRRGARHRAAAAAGGIGAGVRRARAGPRAAVPARSPSFPRCASELPKPGRVDGAAAALPRHPDGGDAPSAACGCCSGRRATARLLFGAGRGGRARCLPAIRGPDRSGSGASAGRAGASAARGCRGDRRRGAACRPRRRRRIACRSRRRGMERGARSRATSRRAIRCSSISPPTGA